MSDFTQDTDQEVLARLEGWRRWWAALTRKEQIKIEDTGWDG